MSLKGRTALVTGAGRNIGRGIALAFALMLGAGGLLFLPERAARGIAGRWLRWEAGTIEAVHSSSLAVVAVQVAVLLATAGSLQLGFSMGNADVGFGACVVFSASTVVTRLVSITPGALGVREFLVGGLALLTGFELRDAVIASTVTRLAEMLVIFSLGGVFSYTLTGQVAATYED